MISKKLIAVATLFPIIIVLILFQGCGGVYKNVIPADIQPIPIPESQEKIDMDIVFVHADDIEEFSYNYLLNLGVDPMDLYVDKLLYNENIKEKKSYRYKSEETNLSVKTITVGEILRKDAEIVLKSVFDNASSMHITGKDYFAGKILDHQQYKNLVGPNVVGIIKIKSPKVYTFYDLKRPEKPHATSNYANELTAQWIFEDLEGNVIWTKEIVGYGIDADYGFFDSVGTIAGKQFQVAIDDHFQNLVRELRNAPEIILYELCLKLDCNSLLKNPLLLHERLNQIEEEHLKKQTTQKLMYMAIEKGNIGLLKELLSTDYIDVNQEEENYQILPIHLSVKKNKLQALELLIRNKSEINAVDNNGWTPLHYAAANGFTKIIDFLIKNGADINAKNYSGQTPFYLAIKNGHKNDWQLLLNNDANYDVINENELLETPSYYYKIGYYFAEKKDKVHSIEAFKVASKYFEKAGSLYADISEKAGSEALIKDILAFSLIVFNEWGSQYQAQQRIKQNAEFKALNDANKMGLSHTQTLDLINDYKSKAINSTTLSASGNWVNPYKML